MAVELQGFSELQNDLTAMAMSLQNGSGVDRALKAGAVPIEQQMKANASSDPKIITGTIYSSIHTHKVRQRGGGKQITIGVKHSEKKEDLAWLKSIIPHSRLCGKKSFDRLSLLDDWRFWRITEMITCKLGDKTYTVEYITGRALREIEPAAKMYTKISEISEAAVKGVTLENNDGITIPDAMDVLIKWFCLLFNNQFTPDDVLDNYPVDRLMHDIVIALFAVQAQTTDVLASFPTTAAED